MGNCAATPAVLEECEETQPGANKVSGRVQVVPVSRSASPSPPVSGEQELKGALSASGHKAKQEGAKKEVDACYVADDAFISGAKRDVKGRYHFKRELRRGLTATVHLVMDKTTGELLACKSICKKAVLKEKAVEDVRHEVQIMRLLAGHENIVELKDVYEDKKSVFLLMEYCTGGDLADFLGNRELNLPEHEVALFFRQIVEAVRHCHSFGIIHRDLKPENVLLCKSAGNRVTLKLADFGFAELLAPGQKAHGAKGTRFFLPPEVIADTADLGFGVETDLWSLGVVLFVMLTGEVPFCGDSDKETFSLIQEGNVDFENTGDGWSSSKQAEDVVRHLLVKDPSKRWTAAQTSHCSWLMKHCRH